MKSVWPFALAATVREREQQLCRAAWTCQVLGRSHADLILIAQAAERLVVGGQDAPSRGAAIGDIIEALEHYKRQGHFTGESFNGGNEGKENSSR